MFEINKIYQGDSLEVLKTFPDKSINCCVTSPPYWGLRDYGHKEQLGLESKFESYIQKLIEIFNEVFRVLKDDGTCFVNIGDTYGGSGKGVGGKNSKELFNFPTLPKVESDIENKCLCQIPSRFSLGMTDNAWILRNEIIWHKPNAMPTSATDRFTMDFEKVFFFVKQQKYHFNQQLEPYTKSMNRWGGENLEAKNISEWDNGTGQITYRNRNMRPNPEGKNMRTVWSINTESFAEAHFATFPEALIDPMIKAGCPKEGLVLDPFMGAGTTGVVAYNNNCNYVGIELNPAYIKIAENRIEKVTSRNSFRLI
jgi:site-specific DNA-methyltransferase (adenine-specific)